ncbi:MAG: hypothetical protein K9G76_05605 [Bacteroidales bacterium]|nr:hypothetical protein [Bacteroidales bacterium]MCF8403156.1 hypothetical protein [Bacteroidales bacterium]
MKTLKKIILSSLFILAISALSAQSPPHPNGGNSPGSSNSPVGGGAPIGSGIVLMMVLSIGYKTTKVFVIRKKLQE